MQTNLEMMLLPFLVYTKYKLQCECIMEMFVC